MFLIWVDGNSDNEFITQLGCASDDVKMPFGRRVERPSIQGNRWRMPVCAEKALYCELVVSFVAQGNNHVGIDQACERCLNSMMMYLPAASAAASGRNRLQPPTNPVITDARGMTIELSLVALRHCFVVDILLRCSSMRLHSVLLYACWQWLIDQPNADVAHSKW